MAQVGPHHRRAERQPILGRIIKFADGHVLAARDAVQVRVQDPDGRDRPVVGRVAVASGDRRAVGAASMLSSLADDVRPAAEGSNSGERGIDRRAGVGATALRRSSPSIPCAMQPLGVGRAPTRTAITIVFQDGIGPRGWRPLPECLASGRRRWRSARCPGGRLNPEMPLQPWPGRHQPWLGLSRPCTNRARARRGAFTFPPSTTASICPPKHSPSTGMSRSHALPRCRCTRPAPLDVDVVGRCAANPAVNESRGRSVQAALAVIPDPMDVESDPVGARTIQ